MPQPFMTFLDEDGDGTSNHIATGDYSSVVKDFKFVVPADFPTAVYLHRLVVQIEDTMGFSADEYGNLGAALTNGVDLRIHDASGNLFRSVTNSSPIKTNAEWAKFCFDVVTNSFGSGNDYLSIRWHFDKAGEPFRIYPGWSFIARLNDNLTGLVNHTFNLQGVYR